MSTAAIILMLFSLGHFTLAETCPNGSIQSYIDKTLCYFFQSEKENFMAAEGICEGFGGHLTSIHSAFENAFVNEQASEVFTDSTSANLWAGANNLYKPGTWTWMDGTSFDFTDWENKQPQNTSDKNCAAINLETGFWVAENCSQNKPFVCLVKASSSVTTTPAPKTTTKKVKRCPLSWTEYNKNCYKVYENLNWLDAEKRCNIDGANLSSVHSLEEALFVAYLGYYQNISICDWTQHAWFGLFTEDNNNHWNWTDGTPFDYFKWLPTQPDGPGEQNCALIRLTDCPTGLVARIGDFDNAYCDKALARAICKKKL